MRSCWNRWSNLNRDPELENDVEQEMIGARIEELFDRYWAEYMATGYIKDLDLSEADLEILSQQQEKPIDKIVWAECEELIMIDWD